MKIPQGVLLGKPDANPREFVNAITLRGGRTLPPVVGAAAESCPEKSVEQPLQQGAPAPTEKEDEVAADPSSKVLRPNELVDEVWSRVYKPPVPYPVPPRDQRDPVSAEKLDSFKKMVRRIPKEISFEEALENRPIHDFFWNCRETQEEIKEIFAEARSTPPPLRVLPKVEDPGKFFVPCSIERVEFEEALCDSGSSVNLMSKAIAEKLKIAEVKPSHMTLRFANSSTSTSYGIIHDLPVQIGDCLVQTDFQVVEMREGYDMSLLLGRPFMATVGAIIDMPNKRVSFSKVNKKVFYKAIPKRTTTHASCISAVDREELSVDIVKELGDKSEINEVLDGNHPHIIKKLREKAKVQGKVQCKRIKGDPKMTLIPQGYDGNSVEYKVKCKGTPKPFSRVRAILPLELKEKGIGVVNGMMSEVLNMRMSDCGACFGVSSQVQPG